MIAGKLYKLMVSISKYKKIILINVLFTCVIVFIIIQITPKWYEAKTTFLSTKASLSVHKKAVSFWGNFQIHVFNQIPIFNFSNDYIVFLRSRTIRWNIIKKYNLIKIYKLKNIDDADKKLQKLTKIKKINEHVISINVKDRSNERAAQIANEYVKELKQININIYNTTIKQKSELVKKRLRESVYKIFNYLKSLQFYFEKYYSHIKSEYIESLLDKVNNLCLKISLFNKKEKIRNDFIELEKKYHLLISVLQAKPDKFPLKKKDKLMIEVINNLKIEIFIYHHLNNQLKELINQQQNSSNFVFILDEAVPSEDATLCNANIILWVIILNIIIDFIIIYSCEYLKNLKHQKP